MLPNTEVLQLVVDGKIGSRLGLSYRGKGLPSIYKEIRRGRIENLVIIANDVHATFATDSFVTLRREFSGTFLYWEVVLPTE